MVPLMSLAVAVVAFTVPAAADDADIVGSIEPRDSLRAAAVTARGMGPVGKWLTSSRRWPIPVTRMPENATV